MSAESVLLLGGPMHGKQIMADPEMGSTIVVPIMQQIPWTRIPDTEGADPPQPSFDPARYYRRRFVIPIARDHWDKITTATGDGVLAEWSAWSEVAVWMTDDYKPEVERAFLVVNATAGDLLPGRDVSSDLVQAGGNGWLYYRLQQLNPEDDYVSEVGRRLLERALDEFDEVIGRER